MSDPSPQPPRAAGAGVFAKFLGHTGSPDDPASLLGLTGEAVTDTQVIAALQRQLTRVGSHPEALSAEADEVRLALHAAAARLLDPTRRKLAPRASAGAPPAPSQEAPSGLHASLLLTLIACGGWNRDAMQRMTTLARAHGIPADEVVDLLRSLGRPAAGAAAATQSAPNAAPARPFAAGATGDVPARPGFAAAGDASDSAAQSQRIVRNLILGVGAGVVGLMLLLVVLVVVVTSDTPAPPAPPPPAPGPVATTDEPPKQIFPTRPNKSNDASGPSTAANRTRLGDWTDLQRELAACIEAVEVDLPQALTRFESIMERMGREWTGAPPDGLVAAVDGVVEFMYRVATNQESSVAAVEAVAAPARDSAGRALREQDVLPVTWSAGVMARLARERDLPSSVRARVQSINLGLPGASAEQSFRGGALGALSVMPARLLPAGVLSDDELKAAAETWRTWLNAVRAVAGKDSPGAIRTTLLAIDGLLTGAPEPTQNRAVFDGITILVAGTPWRAGDESRTWLIRWFDAPAITPGDLYAVTSALSSSSSAAGVDLSMVLSVSAGQSTRAELRDRYATVWGLSAGLTRDALLAKWIEKSRERLSAGPGVSPNQRLVTALSLARASRAAQLLWIGDTSPVNDVLDAELVSVDDDTVQDPTRFGFIELRMNPGTETWAVRYLANKNSIPVRKEILSQITQPPNALEAEVLADEACRGSPQSIRIQAREIVQKHAASPAIVNALLELAPLMPQTNENTDLIERVAFARLPSPRDDAWRVEVRKALVERLLQLLAASSDMAIVEQMSDELGVAYQPPAMAEAPPTDLPPDAAGQPVDESASDAGGAAVEPSPAAPGELLTPEDGAAAWRLRWQREAESLVASRREVASLSEIASRRAARLRLASGHVQVFAAEQAGICELMAYVIVAESPSRSELVRPVIEELDAARRSAKHIFEQIEAGERARLRLWLIRYGESAS